MQPPDVEEINYHKIGLMGNSLEVGTTIVLPSAIDGTNEEGREIIKN